jgi:regulatory protein YycI of two-component signal transduction system YycFG
MDWGKAKTILIFVFIALNIFLLVNIYIYSSEGKISKKTISNAVKTLEQKGITIDCPIPRTAVDPGRLIFKDYKLDVRHTAEVFIEKAKLPEKDAYGEEICDGTKKLNITDKNSFSYSDSSPSSNVKISDKNEVLKYIGSIMKKLDLDTDDYILDSYSMKNGTAQLVYYGAYKGYLIYDSYIKADITQKGITSMECYVKKIQDVISNKNKKIISAYQILLKEYIQEGKLTITDIDMGFKEYSREKDSNELYCGAVWRIITSDNNVQYYSIYDGVRVQ